MRLMSKGEYVIVPKGTKFVGAGKLGLKHCFLKFLCLWQVAYGLAVFDFCVKFQVYFRPENFQLFSWFQLFFVAHVYTLSFILSPIWAISPWFQAVFQLFWAFPVFLTKVHFQVCYSIFSSQVCFTVSFVWNINFWIIILSTFTFSNSYVFRMWSCWGTKLNLCKLLMDNFSCNWKKRTQSWGLNLLNIFKT